MSQRTRIYFFCFALLDLQQKKEREKTYTKFKSKFGFELRLVPSQLLLSFLISEKNSITTLSPYASNHSSQAGFRITHICMMHSKSSILEAAVELWTSCISFGFEYIYHVRAGFVCLHKGRCSISSGTVAWQNPLACQHWFVKQGHVRGWHMTFCSTTQKSTHLLSNLYSCPCEGQESEGRHKISELLQATISYCIFILPFFTLPFPAVRPCLWSMTICKDTLSLVLSETKLWPFVTVRRKGTPMCLKYWIATGFHRAVGSHVDLLHNCEEFTYLLDMKFSPTRDVRNKYVTGYFRPHLFRFDKI